MPTKIYYKCDNPLCDAYRETVIRMVDDNGETLHQHLCFTSCKNNCINKNIRRLLTDPHTCTKAN